MLPTGIAREKKKTRVAAQVAWIGESEGRRADPWAAAPRAMKTFTAYAPVVIGIRVLVVLLMGALVGIPIV